MSLALAALLAASSLASTPATLPSCSWNRPGHNPFMGDLVAAVNRYTDIPAPVRAKLKARMAARHYDDIVDIRRDAIVGRARYGAEIRDMHFGSGQVCGTVNRAGWAANAQERGLVYCEAGHCILVPTVCRNVSRITRDGPAVAADAGRSDGEAAGGGAGGVGGVGGAAAGADTGMANGPAVLAMPAAPAGAPAGSASFADGLRQPTSMSGSVSEGGLPTGAGRWGGGVGSGTGSFAGAAGYAGFAGAPGRWIASAGAAAPLALAVVSSGQPGLSGPGSGGNPQAALSVAAPGAGFADGFVIGAGSGGGPLTAPTLAVPEAGSWALMLGGLLALGWWAGRKAGRRAGNPASAVNPA